MRTHRRPSSITTKQPSLSPTHFSSWVSLWSRESTKKDTEALKISNTPTAFTTEQLSCRPAVGRLYLSSENTISTGRLVTRTLAKLSGNIKSPRPKGMQMQ